MRIVCFDDEFSVDADGGQSIDAEEDNFSSPPLIGFVNSKLFRILDFARSQP